MKNLIFAGSLFWGSFTLVIANSNPKEPIKVLIVGAGLSGLSVAKALQNRGIYPEIIEKESQIRSDGAGIAIPANGSWALDQLEIDIRQIALQIQSMQFTDDQGEILVEEPIDMLHPEKAQFYSLSRDALIQKLLACLDPKTVIQTSRTIQEFSEENDQIRVVFSDGVTKDYDLVIGCDGIYSNLRLAVHPDETPQFLNLLVWRSILNTPHGLTMPTYMLGADRLALLYPMPNQQAYIYGHLFQAKKASLTESFSKVFASFGDLIPKIIYSIDSDKSHFYVHHMEKSHSVRFKLEGFSRVLLVGDAAHAFGPMLQNGAAQAFEDAYVLQDLLTNPISSLEVPALVNAFEKRRLVRVETIFTLSNGKIQALSNPQLIQMRNETIRKSGAPNVNGFKWIFQYNP